ncbi:MAG: glycosyltransferase family 2 protein, partial [Silicimonas sp.]|nr:glycosyltransferase family 2 protein [Silicimonas sp.]
MNRLTRLIDGGIRMLDAERLIRASGLFDPDWYARTYSVADGGQGALSHFLKTGAARGHDPGPTFSTRDYLAANPDVREAGCNALVHYLRHGRDEGRGNSGVDHSELFATTGAAAERIAQAFDADFYRATNPDLADDEAALEHFMATGWRERRDPCGWFSIEAYLMDHPDVAEAGRNPFVHYLFWGCSEGREIRASQRHSPERRMSTAGRQRLAALSMVRNEGDIIRAFSGHLLALFDDIVFVDHMSEDGTTEYLDALASVNRRVSVLRLDEPGYIQSVTMTHMVRSTPVLRDADWVFILDADEFLPFAYREAFEEALARFANCPVIGMHWMNLVPDRYWDGEVSLTPETPFITPPHHSPFRKVAFQPGRLSLGRTVVAQGNHALVETLNGLDVPVFDTDFPLLHLPVRSTDQLILKLNQGADAYRKLGRARDQSQGTHWDQMTRTSAGGTLDDETLNAVVVGYSEDKPDLAPVSVEDLLARGHEVATFDLATSDSGIPTFERPSVGELLLRIRTGSASDCDVPDCPTTTILKVSDGVLRRASADTGAEYPALSPIKTTGEMPGVTEVLSRLMPYAFADIDDLVPSAKGGHIPFLIALTAVARPRRVVEVGTLRGAGFLAICQSIFRNALESEAIAISSWSVGADQADEYRNTF